MEKFLCAVVKFGLDGGIEEVVSVLEETPFEELGAAMDCLAPLEAKGWTWHDEGTLVESQAVPGAPVVAAWVEYDE